MAKMKTNEERKAELEAMTEQMGKQIDSYFESSEKIREHLQFLGKFHQYSMRNAILIESQFPGAVAVGSYPELHAIALNPRNTSIENITVLIHELAHSELHNQERNFERDKPLTAPEKEFQAEMVAYVVSHQLGFPTDDFSLSYLTGWTKDKELLDKEKLLQEVHQTSATFIDHIESHLEKVHTLELEREQTPLEYLEQLNRRTGWKDADLSLYERLHAVQGVFPEEVEPYLNLETNLKMDRVDEPLMYVHDKGLRFQSFGVANNYDFSENALVAYTIALPNQLLISGHFDPEKTVHPLHDLEKRNRSEKPILRSLEERWHDVLLEDEKKSLSRTAILNIERLI